MISKIGILLFTLFCLNLAAVIKDPSKSLKDDCVSEYKCPEAGSISPCTCILDPGDFPFYLDTLEVSCTGPSITQEDVQRLFLKLREVQCIPENSTERLHLYTFRLANTNLTEFDLSPLLRLSTIHPNFPILVGPIEISNNRLLQRIYGPESGSGQGSILTGTVRIRNNSIAEEGLAGVLSYFSPATVLFVDLSYNLLTLEGASSQKFLEDLGKLNLLSDLDLSRNRIERLTGRPFGENNRLSLLDLSYNKIKKLGGRLFERNTRLETLRLGNNEMEGVEHEAFLFDPKGAHPDQVNIYLNGNLLNETNLFPGLPYDVPEPWVDWRHYSLNVADNQFTTLPEELYGLFFKDTPWSRMEMRGNPLICDDRVAWVKNRTIALQYRILYPDCINDEGKTIFTSDLIHIG